MPDPFIAVGHDELGDRARVGDLALCPACGRPHPLVASRNALTGEETDTLLGYTCPETERVYLAALFGQLLPGAELAAAP